MFIFAATPFLSGGGGGGRGCPTAPRHFPRSPLGGSYIQNAPSIHAANARGGI